MLFHYLHEIARKESQQMKKNRICFQKEGKQIIFIHNKKKHNN